jgi:hypothetical protein
MIKKKKKKPKKRKSTRKFHADKDYNKLYRIIITSQNKLLTCVYSTLYKDSALNSFFKIVEENKKVRFPIRYSSRDHKLMPSKYEMLLMKTKNDTDPDAPLFRNEFGKLVPNISNSERMIIFRKEEFLFEESFWIYGLNPRSQRKDFKYILNELIINELNATGLINSKYPVKRVIIYKNKLIIEGEEDFEMIMCKCENDSARLYTELEKEIEVRKIKCVFFSGFAVGSVKYRIENEIMEKTGWNIVKVRRSSTRP